MSLINVRNLGVFSPRVLFQNLSFAIHDTDRVGLVAGNGAGKSTLLRCLAGQADPSTGEITRRRGSSRRFWWSRMWPPTCSNCH